MKWWKILLALFLFESLGLLLFNLDFCIVRDERLIFNPSAFRLAAIAAAAALVVLLLLILWKLTRNSYFQARFRKFILNERSIWGMIASSALLLAATLLLNCLNRDWLAGQLDLYLKLKPFLVWSFTLSLQMWFFATVWLCHLLLCKKQNDDPLQDSTLLTLLGIFSLLVVIKLLFVVPSAYGPAILGDELRYFKVARLLYNGDFYIAETHHSPFLYALMLSISFVFQNHTYQAIKFINILFSSSILFPIFLMSHQLLPKKEALLVTLLASVLPYHLLFPRVLMSENLFFPLLMWAILFVFFAPTVRAHRILWHLNTGTLIGLLFLTRYISLTVSPALALAWWFIYTEESRRLYQPGTQKIKAAAALAGGILLGVSSWFILGLKAHVPLEGLLGFGIASDTHPGQMTIQSLVLWFIFYFCYFILIASPVLSILVNEISSLKRKKWNTDLKNWFIILGTLAVGFYIACVRHSWRADYNDEFPTKIMGRYILYFGILFTISAFALIKNGESQKSHSFLQHFSLTVLIPGALAGFSYELLIGNLFHLHDGDMINILGSIDAAYFRYLGIFYFVFLAALYLFNFALTWRDKLPALKIITFCLLALFFLAGTPAYYQDLLSQQNYQYVGDHIVKMYLSGDYNLGRSIGINMPTGATEVERTVLAHTISFHNLEDVSIITIQNDAANIPNQDERIDQVFIISELGPSDNRPAGGRAG